ncbi:serine hydrolase domain-containing protein [Oscillochloris sp. ZM17-4]|uniref:serine hydrolase domain-containing protein n=1 Tax=Oscillochloris sp. ZM17-4 TaxID=2866714 RepID=UPI00351D3ADF
MTAEPQLPRSAPEEQGVASSAIHAFIDAVEREVDSLHSFMLLRHGHVLAEGWWAPYERDAPHILFSLSKSFTATAVGLAVAEGLLSVDDPVVGFFPDDLPAKVSANLAAMRVRHLLAMSTGHDVDTMLPPDKQTDNWARDILAIPVRHTPGTHFLYNTGATYMLSAIIQRITGVTLLEYLRPRLLDPLGIDHATWWTCPRGINVGGYGLNITTDAIARFGQLYLQKGVWRGQQLVPADWVAAASTLQTVNGDDPQSDWAQGYGYQFWMCRHDAYRGDGAFGQYCVVMPEQDAVLAITGGLSDMQRPLSLAWQHLLPAMGADLLPADPAAQAALAERLAGLELAPPSGLPTPALAAEVSGHSYMIEPNEMGIEAIGLRFDPAGCTITIRNGEGEHQIAAGDGAWRAGETTFSDRPGSHPVAAAGAWESADRYRLVVYYTETPFRVTATFRFAGDRLELRDFGQNVGFGPTAFPDLKGGLVLAVRGRQLGLRDRRQHAGRRQRDRRQRPRRPLPARDGRRVRPDLCAPRAHLRLPRGPRAVAGMAPRRGHLPRLCGPLQPRRRPALPAAAHADGLLRRHDRRRDRAARLYRGPRRGGDLALADLPQPLAPRL